MKTYRVDPKTLLSVEDKDGPYVLALDVAEREDRIQELEDKLSDAEDELEGYRDGWTAEAGKEAEELRSAPEKATADGSLGQEAIWVVQRILDSVDARDSLLHCEEEAKCSVSGHKYVRAGAVVVECEVCKKIVCSFCGNKVPS